jgi:release factor glutamine methyltransferase
VQKCVPPPARILDLGTGGGCIALALAKVFPETQVTAVDASEEALALARENATATGLAARVQFVHSDWFAALPAGDKFDAIVANPPYLTAAETAETQPEVRSFEPALALTAAEDGLAALRVIVAGASAHMAPGGLLAVETGIAQHAALLRLMEAAGLRECSSHRDLAGRDRYVLARS